MKLLNILTGIFTLTFPVFKYWDINQQLNANQLEYNNFSLTKPTPLKIADPTSYMEFSLGLGILFLITFLFWTFTNIKKKQSWKPIITSVLILLMFLTYALEVSEITVYLDNVQIGNKPLE